jgi:hypothetical protein
MSLLHTKQCLQLLAPIFSENVWCRPALKNASSSIHGQVRQHKSRKATALNEIRAKLVTRPHKRFNNLSDLFLKPG